MKNILTTIIIICFLGIILSCNKTEKTNAHSVSTKQPELNPLGLKMAKVFVVSSLESYLKTGNSKGFGVNWAPVVNVDTRIYARSLAKDYNANEVAADNKYKGKMVAVTGVVTQISKDVAGDVFVALSAGDNVFEGVQAYLDSKSGVEAATLSKGQKIGLVCRVDGMMIGQVILRECMGQRDFREKIRREMESNIDGFFAGQNVSMPQLEQVKAMAYMGYLVGARDSKACDGHSQGACEQIFHSVTKDIQDSKLSEQEKDIAKRIRLDLAMLHLN